jgi:hypothetical protein
VVMQPMILPMVLTIAESQVNFFLFIYLFLVHEIETFVEEEYKFTSSHNTLLGCSMMFMCRYNSCLCCYFMLILL